MPEDVMSLGTQGLFQEGRKSLFQLILGGQSFAARGILAAGAAHLSLWEALWPQEGFGGHGKVLVAMRKFWWLWEDFGGHGKALVAVGRFWWPWE